MPANEYLCSCGSTGKLLKFPDSKSSANAAPTHYLIRCSSCQSQTFRFDTPEFCEAFWARMDDHSVQEVTDKQYRVA